MKASKTIVFTQSTESTTSTALQTSTHRNTNSSIPTYAIPQHILDSINFNQPLSWNTTTPIANLHHNTQQPLITNLRAFDIESASFPAVQGSVFDDTESTEIPKEEDSTVIPRVFTDNLSASTCGEEEKDGNHNQEGMDADDTANTRNQNRNTRNRAKGKRRRGRKRGTKRKFQCEVCHKQFVYRSKWMEHCRIHQKVKAFQCNQCDKRFKQRTGLRHHIANIHKQIKKYKCDICWKQFYQRSDWTAHCRIHREERAFVCNECGKAFKQKEGLRHHIEYAHDKIRNYHCDLCGKAFYKKTDLRDHYRIHTGEKPFGCRICQKKFRTLSQRNRHENTFACRKK